ncbi:MAG: neutral/alkaline non-lysosomal ceramidase N-terminal domain-containing protein [Stagnimonas sp.]|nr:neutral/alkaline non-lysosomal ceramidase N-terminal domain-containing protein [Stagnimonas sp.]
MQSPFLSVGAGLDAPGRLGMPVTVGAQPAGACKGNTQFRFGSGRYDVTGVVANTGGMGWENLFQILSGLHTRQYARAFAIWRVARLRRRTRRALQRHLVCFLHCRAGRGVPLSRATALN